MAKYKILMYIGLLSLTASIGDYLNVNKRVYDVFHRSKIDEVVNVVDDAVDSIENKIKSFSLKPSSDSYDINDLSLKVKEVNDEEYFVYLEYKKNVDGNVSFTDIPIYRKINGPQLGSLKYIYDNFSQKDKVSFLEFYVKDSPNILRNAFEEIWNNKSNIYSDVKDKILRFLYENDNKEDNKNND